MGYLLVEGFRNVLKNKKSTVAALTVMCIAMLMFGAFFIIGENINYIVEQVSKEQGMQVFVNIKATDEEIEKIEPLIRKIEGVNQVTYVSKTEALNSIKENWKDYPKIMEGLSENMVQASYTVTLTDLSLNKEVQEKIKKIDNIESIETSNDTIERLQTIAHGLRIGIAVILVALVFMSVANISNTIKLSVHARRKEISIMKYVGATNGFIRWPFVIEGAVIGITSAIITVLIVGLGYNFLAEKALQLTVLQNLNIKLKTFADMFSLIMTVYLGLGIGIGIFGSSISMKKYLEV